MLNTRHAYLFNQRPSFKGILEVLRTGYRFRVWNEMEIGCWCTVFVSKPPITGSHSLSAIKMGGENWYNQGSTSKTKESPIKTWENSHCFEIRYQGNCILT